MIATGEFSIELSPTEDDAIEAGRMSFTKLFSGDIAGSSEGQMLSKRTATVGSAAYVAIETFVGAIDGRQGEVSFHHTGVMDRGADSLSVLVVPDSGTADLAGISGSMMIKIESGVHRYHFEYEINQQK
ncbi:DUF3224 domain-containing protein [Shewanella kaireitica]|uniref:DUF3224 domain-containing protein n=1 Tax=Shewanella kaireitica TaxID=212021 RepID=UPI00200F2FC9|nr:DUF3224 domain-containing protein [Shewanella kaireitica]MCL1092945.1 DUF3224 domain-containing protein [Shewanella kaireitica]